MNLSVRSEITDVPWRLRDIVKAIIALMVVGAAGTALLLYWQHLGSPGGRELLIALLGPAEMVLFVAAWFFGGRRSPSGLRSLGFRSFDFGKGLGLVLLALFVAIGVNAIYAAIIEQLGLQDLLPPSPRELFGTGLVNLVLALLAASVLAPLAEETFFRGFVLPAFAKRWGITAGVIASSILFGLFHGAPGAFVPITIIGVLLAWLYVRTGSIWPSMILHGLYNTAGVIAIFATQGA